MNAGHTSVHILLVIKMRKRQKRTFVITRGQIFFALLMAVVALTAAFEIGVSVGKKRIIDAEREVMRRSNPRWDSIVPESDEKNHPGDSENTEKKAVQQSDTEIQATMRIPTGGDLPIESPQEQPTEQRQTETSVAKYTVQIGTFSSHQNAEDLVALLKSYEYNSWLRPERTAEGELYSVFVGGFSIRDEAKQFGESLKNRLSFVTDYMVREISR